MRLVPPAVLAEFMILGHEVTLIAIHTVVEACPLPRDMPKFTFLLGPFGPDPAPPLPLPPFSGQSLAKWPSSWQLKHLVRL